MLPHQMKKLVYLLLAGISFTATAQTPVITSMQEHVRYLSDDKLEGRATGSKGEQLAAGYIIEHFSKNGLQPAGDGDTFLQAFEARAGKKAGQNNFILAKGKMVMDDQLYPHPMSANATVTGSIQAVGFGISAPSLQYDDYAQADVKGKIVLIKTSSPDGTHPHSKYIEFNDERKKIQTAAAKGAIGVLFYNTDENYTLPTADYRRNVTAETLPVFIIDAETADRLSMYTGPVTLSTDLQEETYTGHNVLAYKDNHAAHTIVIGAHYDHLGHGEIEGSLYRGEAAIHNGADDNASGIAMLIELANKLSRDTLTQNNYLFIAFSGEEMGLFGSKAFVHSTAMKNYSINYMLNYDMVGRMDTTHALIINGAGTSSDWSVLQQLAINPMKITTTESGIGPSDQTSFYLNDIPVLHFFTGSHADYHKPSDDEHLINYAGMKLVYDYSLRIIGELDENGKINFTKTKDSNNDNTPRFTVTLGLVPDYAYTGKGMRVDGVSDGKPAQKAGLQAGDIIIKLGAFDVTDMMGYMESLSKFSKGQSTTVTIMRNETVMELPVQF